ncbi:O-antigen ligase family protein [Nocardioides caldifontis]|uniref:O-antigen ligase family protein n=1 Tax=Nocardioides caldifontis TaxID=2588938 RepID=UPI0011E04D0D|nr:O-antigen ligase family protein [Nocardioides caldifontis]
MTQRLLVRSEDSAPPPPSGGVLPRWPFAALFVGFPIWWVLGLVDVAWIMVAAVMCLYLAQVRLRVPRGFGVWLLFLLWAGGSVIMVGGGMDLVGFAYRYLLYVASTVLAIYVYNAREQITSRYVTGCLTVWWLVTVAGGYLGVVHPSGVWRTPASWLLTDSLLNNQLVNHMVVRRFAQYNPDSFLQVAPRPSAPFLYTNNWGNVFSLLLPFVLVYMWHVRGERKFWWLVAALPVSAVPALLTLNRGMFIGLGIALLYAAVRLAMRGSFKAIGALALVAALGSALYMVLPIQERLAGRLDSSADATSNDTRASLYLQAIELVPDSPFFGYGAPQAGAESGAAPVGTQGQIWMLLVSHGPIASICFVAFFAIALLGAWRRIDPVGTAAQTVLLVGLVELLYYGMLPNGLPIMMVAAALGLRPTDPPPDAPPDSPTDAYEAAAPGQPA